MAKCVVSGCPNRMVNVNRGVFTRPQKRFFKFPSDPARVKVWHAALRETDKQDSSDQQWICEDHFLPEDISANGVASDAIPIMPPFLDGPLGLVSPWGAESSEEEEQMAGEGFKHDDGGVGAPDLCLQQQVPDGSLKTSAPLQQLKDPILVKTGSRMDVSLLLLTQRFLEVMLEAPGCSVDLRQVAKRLQIRKQRIYDITNVLDGICVIEKESASRVRWIGRYPISRFLGKNKYCFQKELDNLKLVEATLDSLIKSCAQQLFDMTDDVENSALAYVTHEDVGRLQAFQEQTVIAIKAPEETKLEIPVPTEDSVQVHLKAGRAPIAVLTCELGSCDAETSGSFVTLEESLIRTRSLHTAPQTPAQSV